MLWFSSFIQVIFTSQVVFNLPSGIAVTGVPLQSFLLAACWHSNSCSCFARIDFPRTAPSKAYLQATALQQNINAVSFSAVSFFQKKKKNPKHFQQSPSRDVINSERTEDEMLLCKGLHESSASPLANSLGKSPCPAISVDRTRKLRIGVCMLYQGS